MAPLGFMLTHTCQFPRLGAKLAVFKLEPVGHPSRNQPAPQLFSLQLVPTLVASLTPRKWSEPFCPISLSVSDKSPEINSQEICGPNFIMFCTVLGRGRQVSTKTQSIYWRRSHTW